MSAVSLRVELPEGIACYSSIHGYYEWPPERKVAVLVHHDWDLLWLRSGAAQWTLEDGRTLTAKAGQFVVLPPLFPMRMQCQKGPLGYWFCHFSFRLPASVHGNDATEAMVKAARGVRVPLVFDAARAPGLVRAFGALKRLDRHDALFGWRIESATLRLVSELVGFARAEKNAAREGVLRPNLLSNARINAVCERIQGDPARPWTVAELAKSVGLSRSRLHYLSRRTLGRSLKSFMIDSRLALALRLLKETRDGNPLSIKEVSVACGFSSQHLLSRQFQHRFKLSPRQYQQGSMVA